MQRPNVLRRDVIHRGYVSIKQDLLSKESGEELLYTHFSLPSDAVVILAETHDKKFILNREYRHPTESHLLGCPGGRLEKDEEPIDGARRELLEETGYLAAHLELMGVCYPFAALCNQKIYMVLAKELRFMGQSLDPFEYIQTEIKSEAEIMQEIQAGAILDALLLSALKFRTLKK